MYKSFGEIEKIPKQWKEIFHIYFLATYSLLNIEKEFFFNIYKIHLIQECIYLF